MKLFMIAILLIFSNQAIADGLCGPNRPAIRTVGQSLDSMEEALLDSRAKALKICKEACEGAPGSVVISCGVVSEQWEYGDVRTEVDYACSCGF